MGSKSKKIKKNENNEIKSLLEKLTHSGKDSLHVDQLKVLKSICSSSKNDVKIVYDELMTLLEKKHSEVRFSTVQLCDELFRNDVTFRTLLIGNIRTFLKYLFDEPLPPPKLAAKKLLKLVITCIDNWHSKFGAKEYKLQAAYKHLKKQKNVDFEIKEIVDPKKRMEEKEKEKKQLMLNKEHLKKTNGEMESLKPEIEMTVTSLESCFSLLLPSPEEFDTDLSSSVQVEESEDFEMRLFGVVDPRHTVEIQFDKSEKIEIRENEDNSSILCAAKEAYTLIKNRFLPKTKAWLELLTRVNDNSQNGIVLMNQAKKQELKLNQLVKKYEMLNILPMTDQTDEVSSDSDLEEVPQPKTDKVSRHNEEIGFLSELIVESKDKSGVKPKKEENASNNINNDNEGKEKASTDMSERKKELLKVAPKLPYDIDLYHWEDEKLPTPTVLAVNCEGARFWAGASEDISELPIPGGSSVLRTRVIEFSGEFVPVERACKVPLPTGKLCPRKDRIKCPFHGLIVDRDDKGNIINEEDMKKVASLPFKSVTPDWQDPKLLAEIKEATGVDLKMPEKGKRKSKVKYPGLTDLNAAKKTPKARISKKIFNKASLRRVAAVMNNIEYKKHRDKFGDQFNYVHSNS